MYQKKLEKVSFNTFFPGFELGISKNPFCLSRNRLADHVIRDINPANNFLIF